jgi:hypothetical protein
MGSAFSCVVVPKNIQNKKDLKNWCKKYREDLIESYGGDNFEGYSGDMASDNGDLIITNVKLNYQGQELENNLDEMQDVLMDVFEPHVEKWGPSVAIKVGDYWVIGGAYSD